MNITTPRKSKQKHIMLPTNIETHSIKRVYSEIAFGVIEEHSPNTLLPRVSLGLPQTQHVLHKKIQVLDQMGFGSLIASNSEPNFEVQYPLKRRFSIGISDFWTGTSKHKFIRDQGYKEAFETLKKDVLISDLQKETSLKKPTLPYIMDSNAKRRNLMSCENSNSVFQQTHRNLRVLKPKANKLSFAINEIVEKCEKLTKESLQFKKEAQKIQLESKQSSKIKKKVTKQEKDLISSIICSLN